RLDFPDPDRPVTTTSLSRGISTEMFLRLWTRAPCTATVARALGFVGDFLEGIASFAQMHERELLDAGAALLREPRRDRYLADETLIGEVLARPAHTAEVEVSNEVIVDLATGPCLTHLAQMLEDRREQRVRTIGHVAIDGAQGRFDVGARL